MYANHVASTSTSAFGIWALMVHTPATSVLSTPLGVCYPLKDQNTPGCPFACTPPSRAHHACTEYFYVVESFSIDFVRFDVSFEFVNWIISLLNVIELLHYSRVSKFLHKIWKSAWNLVMWFIRKIIELVATRCKLLRLKCTKLDFGWGSAPDPAYSAPPDPLAGFKGSYF